MVISRLKKSFILTLVKTILASKTLKVFHCSEFFTFKKYYKLKSYLFV